MVRRSNRYLPLSLSDISRSCSAYYLSTIELGFEGNDMDPTRHLFLGAGGRDDPWCITRETPFND